MSSSNSDNSRVIPLVESDRIRVAELVRTVGEKEAARQLGVSRHTTIRAVAGMALHPGTRLLLQHWIATTSAANAASAAEPAE